MIEQLDDLGDSAEARGRVLAAVDAHTAEALASRGGGQVEAVERVEAEVAAAPERAFRFAADGSAVLVAGRRRVGRRRRRWRRSRRDRRGRDGGGRR
ncbi:MAG TPA: hypothetical protein PKU97_17800, partial [Kofleriaceae bacterium]|nr:hypothetical protein [Kofleriaceae bacterium]